MKKKLLLSLAAVVAISVGVVGMGAFEAHIINVTAQIENALYVPVEAKGLSFGTVFPEEVQYQNMDIQLSQSFMTEPRVDDVEYMLRQKPKCGVPVPNTDPMQYSSFPQVMDGPNGTFVCPERSVMLPLLCPYLSKQELDVTGKPIGEGIPAFHGPLTDWTLADTIETQLLGRLSKAAGKTSATWQLDLHAPCFEGMCAQDNVIPEGYQADPANEHQMFGCDLWIEVTNISIPPDKASLTVIKHVINDSGTGSKSAPDFTMNVTGTNPVPATFAGNEAGVLVVLDPGSYSVSEDPMTGYTSSASADCVGTIAVGENKTCTITNDDIPREEGNLTVIKVVENNGVGTKVAGDFQMTIDGGNVNQNQAYSVSVGNHNVSEVVDYGYSKSYSAECPGGVANVPLNGDVKCTVTNTYPAGTLTVRKVVVDKGGIGTKVAGDFQMKIDGNDVIQDQAYPVTTGNHAVSEADNFGYDVTYSAECPGGVANVPNGGAVTCTVTNTMPYFTVTVTKVVVNTPWNGNNVISDFNLFVGANGVTSGVSKNVAVGTYLISESGVNGYSAAFTGDCDSDTQLLTGANGDNKTCTITNTVIAPNITLVKAVDSGPALPTDFIMRIDGGVPVPTGSSKLVTANTAHTITEDAKAGYHFVSITGNAKCPATLGGTVTLDEGEAITCTIHNAINP